MKRRYWLVVFMAGLMLCVGISLLLVSRINDARLHLAQAGPGAFNYFLQTNRSLNAFVDALQDYRQERNLPSDAADTGAIELRKQYRQQFDVVWGGFTVFDVNFRFRPEQQNEVTKMLAYANDYLTGNEQLMLPDHELSEADIDKLIAGARSISEKVNDIGHHYFIFATHISDSWNQRLYRLYQLVWGCVLLLLITLSLLINMLVRSFKRSADLVDKSHRTQHEMKHLIDELRSGKLENKAKDSFIAAASHDLRQPLHALGFFLGATEKHIENDAGRASLSEAKHCTAELNRLFNSLLDLSRLDAGVVEVNKTQFRLDRLFNLMTQEFAALAYQDDIHFEVCDGSDVVRTDALLLNRILRNLLENAITHSGATRVGIHCQRTDSLVRLTVTDNGVGIPVTEHSDIFSEYYQLEKPESDRSKGLGLGLSIVKRLCDMLDISVTLESGDTQGTRFHLDVPAGQESSATADDTVVATVDVWEPPEGTLVAVIDDDEQVRKGMLCILNAQNINAIAAESADEMIDQLSQQGDMPDVVIADYRLRENQTGDIAIHRVRAAFASDIPAIIITGDTSPRRMQEAASSGFELMHKPVEPAELFSRIGKLVRPRNRAVKQTIAELN